MEKNDGSTGERQRVAQLQLFHQPRQGKKLLVLDIDKTIYDCTCSNIYRRTRPYLHQLLEESFKYYDICLWSLTDMNTVKFKVNTMNIGNSSDFKILFYMDATFSEMVMKQKPIITKPLSKIWNVLDQYGPTNTIICDDNPDNLVQNPKNGILVAPYYFKNFSTDKELQYLQNYLKYLSEAEDVRKVDHKKWKEIEMKLRK
ncbi:hypothetical protein ILUMI_21190 [Ignelater luminosus]|uniref:FCP1 homology domain-containing protein n=1 Tax=Ignelater luminosus TaxID=2038154 RepID=A0A8K0G3X1_IGNLU|nr:hypothetical protein ILUMI_21190 [Ignelater luminosus]